jgi:hypothetical protein
MALDVLIEDLDLPLKDLDDLRGSAPLVAVESFLLDGFYLGQGTPRSKCCL